MGKCYYKHIHKLAKRDTMNNHYLQAPEDSHEQTDQFLPDRSALADLYPQAKPATVTLEEQATALDIAAARRLPLGSRLFIAVAIPLPFLAGLAAVQFLANAIEIKAASSALPVIVIGSLLWIGWLALTGMAVSKRLSSVNLSLAPFLAIYAICLLPLAQAGAVAVYSLVNHSLAANLVFASIVFGLSFAIVNLLLRLVTHSDWSDAHRKGIFLGIICLCFGACAASILIF
jgi:hypothetical protein